MIFGLTFCNMEEDELKKEDGWGQSHDMHDQAQNIIICTIVISFCSWICVGWCTH
jgi:hypothetical protein